MNLARALATAGAPIIGTSVDSIDVAEDRDKFQALVNKLRLRQPSNGIARDLQEHGIEYVIVGGMALNAHGYHRETVDVDILLTPEGLEQFLPETHRFQQVTAAMAKFGKIERQLEITTAKLAQQSGVGGLGQAQNLEAGQLAQHVRRLDMLGIEHEPHGRPELPRKWGKAYKIDDAKERAAAFAMHMASFYLDEPEQAGYSAKSKQKRQKADYLRMVRGWSFDADGREGAALKGWVESRFGLLP